MDRESFTCYDFLTIIMEGPLITIREGRSGQLIISYPSS
jgi:hypothetical protein